MVLPSHWHFLRLSRFRIHTGTSGQRCVCSRQSPPKHGIVGLDHAAVGVRNLSRSLSWYKSVLGMDHVLAENPNFNGDIAMAGVNGNPLLALLLLPEGEEPLLGSRSQRGHFALRTDPATFLQWCQRLPELLKEHRLHENQSLWIQEDDYGIQKSIFFEDPDGNEIEITAWFVE
eukprot:TRINITY_DN102603_c0_g1_i1.p2 TRINITY_DN102603_c0_g1~~TRINITY_DN102603_c0_g1_i1.p2  ORF type:complete len:174 (-),score=24.10 TRINITY_DN102603_c0_g1_i1:398-919(-)